MAQRSSNGPPTPSETRRIQQYIALQESDIDHLSSSLRKEESRYSLTNDAIHNLSMTIDHAKKYLSALRENLASLRKVEQSFIVMESLARARIEDEPETASSYDILTNLISLDLATSSPSIKKHIETTEGRMKKIKDYLGTLEGDLAEWNLINKLAKGTVLQLRISIEDIQTARDSARAVLSPIRKIHRELWIYIFQMCVNEELAEFLSLDESSRPFRSIPVTLSQVCKSWRNVIYNEGDLWSIITVPPTQYIPRVEYEQLSSSISRARKNLMVLVNLNQTVRWSDSSYSYYGYQDMCKNEAQIPEGINGTLHLVANDDDISTVMKASYIPFRNVTRLIVTIRSKGSQGGLARLLNGFEHISHFELIDKGSRSPSLEVIAERINLFKYLNLRMQDITTIDLGRVLNINLVEIRIRHNGNGKIGELTNILRLENLKTLGIIYPDIGLLEKLDIPALTTLEVYGSENGNPAVVTGEQSLRILSRIRHIEMQDWKEWGPVTREIGASRPVTYVTEAFSQLASLSTSIRTVKFLECTLSGSLLIEFFKSYPKMDTALPYLESLCFERCTGITYSDYAAIHEYIADTSFY